MWEDLIHDLRQEIDCLRYQLHWTSKGIVAIEETAFKRVATRWLSMPKVSPQNAHPTNTTLVSGVQQNQPLDLQLREGFTMLKGEEMDTELRECRDANTWRSMDPWEKDLVRENH
jgi:IS30 family transposase